MRKKLLASTLILMLFLAPLSLGLAADKIFHGNKKSKKFHQQSCRYFDCQNCVTVFNSFEEAVDAGYIPCKVCKPTK